MRNLSRLRAVTLDKDCKIANVRSKLPDICKVDMS